ncbi:MAG: DUF362 domain-containing protein [Theionarchaea archaeon]|nr:DUF362 domain-containing protein [Theionarchaea archaeon]MBU7021979.1 DUF362 domain-containing protein [Theionarchaea archaeon]MBU7041369.1 DUF362 domain-containing protein [Theionarchaea archaeon]
MSSVLVLDAEYPVTRSTMEAVFSHFTPPVSRTLVKPNLLGGFESHRHVTTHPSLIQALVEYFEQHAIPFTVGDNPAGKRNLIERAKKAGIYQASKGHFEDISEGKRITIESDFFSELVVSRKVLESPYIVNVPKFKTHIQTIITGAVKNMFGILPGEEKSMVHCAARSLTHFSRALVDIYALRPPDLSIMDAVMVMEGNGPSSGNPRHLGKILASDNAVELDAVMAWMMGLSPHDVPMLEYAHHRGLGAIDVDKIDVRGDIQKIPHFKVPSRKLVTFITPVSSRYYDLLAVKPALNRTKCTQCYECVEKCPVSALQRNEYPHINRKKCVSCFCCVEGCENQAMEVPSRARDLFNRLLKM